MPSNSEREYVEQRIEGSNQHIIESDMCLFD